MSITLDQITPFNKELLRSLSPEGYYYIGYWDKMYHYQKETEDNKFSVLNCIANDLIDGSINLMIKYGVTRGSK